MTLYEELIERGLIYGAMPEEGEVLISRALAETLKTQFRLPELSSDRAMLLVVFEGEYRISGITDGATPAVYLNKVDYVNFLGVYNTVQFNDYNNLFFAADFAGTSYTSEILLSDSSTLGDSEVTVEINRNSLYKMMSDTTQADYLVNVTNSRLASTSGTSTAIQIVGSRPMYVQRFEITRDVMSTDIRIYVNENTLSNIFVALQPDIDALQGTTSSAGIASQFYFEIKTDGGEQLASLTSPRPRNTPTWATMLRRPLTGTPRTSGHGRAGRRSGCTTPEKSVSPAPRCVCSSTGGSFPQLRTPSSGLAGSGAAPPSGTRATAGPRRDASASRRSTSSGDPTGTCPSAGLCPACPACSSTATPRTAST